MHQDRSERRAQMLCVGAVVCVLMIFALSFKRHESASELLVHITFDHAGTRHPASVTNVVNGSKLEVRHGAIGKGYHGAGLVFYGHPDQGIVLGVLDQQQPVTVALWLKREGSPKLDTNGANRPEYKQEHGLGKGRLLGPLSGNPNDNSGSLRIGPEKLEVWHARDHWSVLIPGPLAVEKWMHIAVTFDEQQQATGYLNGQRKNTTHSAFNFGKNEVVLGGASLLARYGFPFAGCIDDVRIYRGVLTEKEIALLAGLRK